MSEQHSARVRHDLSRTRGSIQVLREYEKPIWPNQCQQASRAIIDLYRDLGRLHPSDIQQQVQIEHLREQTEEARLLIAAYTPRCQSMELHHLRECLHLVKFLCQLVAEVERIGKET